MEYKKLTAACGRDCFNCYFYLAKENENIRKMFSEKLNVPQDKVQCNGCREIRGDCQILKNYGFNGKCKIYGCVSSHNVNFCYECSDFPCDLLHPLADGADKFPHNLKVYNLCLIKKMGVENWAKNKAKQSFDRYYNDKLDTCV